MDPKRDNWGQGLLAVYHKLAFSGTTPYSLTFSGQCGKLAFSLARLTEINVADITGDDAADVTFADSNFGPLGSPAAGYSVGFKKTGTGTLVFSKPIKHSEAGGSGRGLIGLNGKIEITEGLIRFDSDANLNGGDIEVSGGALLLGSGQSAYTVPSDLGQTYIGSLTNENRTITASGTGKIYFPQRYMFYAPGNAGVADVAPATFVAKNGGELVIGAPTWTSSSGATAFFPNIRLETGGKVTLNAEAGSYPNGAYGVMGKFSFGGTAAITVPAGSAKSHMFLLNSGASTVFEVEDITGDSGVDATFSLPMGRFTYQIDVSAQKQVGFRKTGAGTFKIDFSTSGLGAAGLAAPNGTIAVEAGALMLSTSLPDVSCAVSAGAYLQPNEGAGHYKLKNLAIAENGGFRVQAQNVNSSVSVTNSIALPSVGVVDIVAADAAAASCARAQILTVPARSTLSKADFANWTFTVNGQPTNLRYKIFRKENGIYLKSIRGLVVLVN